MKKWSLRKKWLNNKGLTLLEAVIAIGLLALIGAGVTSLFFSMTKISRMSEEQLRMNALIRVIKENVATSVRNDDPIYGNENDPTDATDDVHAIHTQNYPTDSYTIRDLIIKDLKGETYEYTFDLQGASTNNTNDLKKYTVYIKKDGQQKLEFSFDVYKP